MLFGEGRFFHDLQSVAAYRTAAKWDGPLPQPAPDAQLGALRTKLKAAQPLKLVTLGDSISAGANASGAVGAPPGQQDYHLLIAAALTERFKVNVTEVWTAVAARKNYLSLSGNGLNHPNDFGHRLYADVLLTVIGGQ